MWERRLLRTATTRQHEVGRTRPFRYPSFDKPLGNRWEQTKLRIRTPNNTSVSELCPGYVPQTERPASPPAFPRTRPSPPLMLRVLNDDLGRGLRAAGPRRGLH